MRFKVQILRQLLVCVLELVGKPRTSRRFNAKPQASAFTALFNVARHMVGRPLRQRDCHGEPYSQRQQP